MLAGESNWQDTVDADDHVASFDLVPNDDGTEIGVTQVTVSIAADVVKDASGNGNIAVSETYTVGPILTIPAGGYIVVIRPEHNMQANLSERSHLFGGRLYLGSTGVTGLPITIKEWDCMPDLTSRSWDIRTLWGSRWWCHHREVISGRS